MSEDKQFVVPPTTETEGGWEEYSEPIVVTPENAAELRPGTASPEAAAVHFYAALMSGDEAFKEALPNTEEDPFGVWERKLKTLDKWTFEHVELRARRLRGDSRCSLRLFMRITVSEGRTDEGEDECEVRRQDDGRWLVTRPPT